MKERQDYKAWYYLPVPQETYDKKMAFIKNSEDKSYVPIRPTITKD